MARFKHLRAHPQFLTRLRHEPSDLATVNLQTHKWTWSIQLCSKLVTIGVLVTAIAFGGASQVFTIKSQAVLGSTVDPDLQLAFLGLINKIMDLFVVKILQVTASVVLTLWMTKAPHSGIRLADFELAEELTKPWAALSEFQERWSNRGMKHAGWFRLLITLSTSVCVLLQGLAINTIGVPKERWSPELPNITGSHPRVHLQSVDWGNFWNDAWGTVGDGYKSWQVTESFIASSTHTVFRNYAWRLASRPPGWQTFGADGEERLFPAIDTRSNGSSSRGVAVNSQQAVDIFRWL